MFVEEIYAMFGHTLTKMARSTRHKPMWCFKVSSKVYTQVFRNAHVLNDILSLEFAHAVVVENKDIIVNWATDAYSAYKRQRSLETAIKTRHKNLL